MVPFRLSLGSAGIFLAEKIELKSTEGGLKWLTGKSWSFYTISMHYNGVVFIVCEMISSQK